MYHAAIMLGSIVVITLAAFKLLDSSNNGKKLLWSAVFAVALLVLSLHITDMRTATTNYMEHTE